MYARCALAQVVHVCRFRAAQVVHVCQFSACAAANLAVCTRCVEQYMPIACAQSSMLSVLVQSWVLGWAGLLVNNCTHADLTELHQLSLC
jgi:hypothetical protein